MNKLKLISIFCMMLFLFIPVSNVYAQVELPQILDVELPEEPFQGELSELIVEVGSYEPTIITSSVLEEQDVSVYANLIGIPTNPTLSISKIDRIITTVEGTNPYVLGNPRYHKPRTFSLTDLGYLEIRLKQIPREEDIPDVIDINMSARIYYDVERLAVGGEDTKTLAVVSEAEFLNNMDRYGFLGDRAFVRVKNIGANSASFELFNSEGKRIAAFILNEDETSRVYSLVSGSDLLQDNVRIRLDDIKRLDAKVNLSIEGENILLLEDDFIYGSDWKVDIIDGEENYIVLYKRGIDQSIVLRKGEDITLSDTEIERNLNLVKEDVKEKDIENFKKSLEEFRNDISENFVLENIIPAFERNAKIKIGTTVGRYEEGDILVEDACEDLDCSLTQIRDDRILVEVPNEDCNRYLTRNLEVNDEEDLHNYCGKSIELEEIRTGKLVTITMLTGTGSATTVSDFRLHLPIEKRLIQFAPEALDDKINNTKETIEKLEKYITNLDKIVKTWTKVCLGVGSVIAIGAFFGGFKKGLGVEKVAEKIEEALNYVPFKQGEGYKSVYSQDLFERDGRIFVRENGEYIEYKRQPIVKDDKRFYYNKGEVLEYSGNFIAVSGTIIYKDRESNEYIIPLRSDPLSFTRDQYWQYDKWKGEYGNGLFAIVNSDERFVEVYNVGPDGQISKNLKSSNDDMFIESFSGEVYDDFERKHLRRISDSLNREMDSVVIDGKKFGLNAIKEFVAEKVECTDVMSEEACVILFNACDPVMCPSSRCNLGGLYEVDNVVQSGLVGSLTLCAPNFPETLVPFCLSGILASLKVINSYLEGYVQCLTTAKVEGLSVGVCDKIRSIFMCETIWNEVMTFLNVRGGFIGLAVEKLFGATAKGGGEYLGGIGAGIENTEKVVSYFVDSYATSAFAAYIGQSTKEIGTELCKMAIYGKGPAFGEFFEQISTPEDPYQFTAFFEEQPWSTRTRESRYQVYYHIYSGAQEIRYSVFLRSEDLPTEFVVRSESLLPGEFADEARDLIAGSGYQEICVEVNGKIECGFGKIVSTSFGISRIGDYLVSHDLSRNIKSERQCISEPAGGLFPDVAITRKCSAENPGRGLGVEVEQRWVDVGSCGEDKGRCWLEVGDLADAASRNDNPSLIRDSFNLVCERQDGEVCKVGQVCNEDGERIFLNTVRSANGDEVVVRCCSKNSCVDTDRSEDILSDIKAARDLLVKDGWKPYQLNELDKAIENDDFMDRVEDNFDIRDEVAGLANVRRHHPYEFFYFKGMNAFRSDYCYVAKDILSCEDEDMVHKVYFNGEISYFSCADFEENIWYDRLYDSYRNYCEVSVVDEEEITKSILERIEEQLKILRVREQAKKAEELIISSNLLDPGFIEEVNREVSFLLEPKENEAGRYYRDPKLVTISKNYKNPDLILTEPATISTIFHELAHYHWHVFLSKNQKEEFTEKILAYRDIWDDLNKELEAADIKDLGNILSRYGLRPEPYLNLLHFFSSEDLYVNVYKNYFEEEYYKEHEDRILAENYYGDEAYAFIIEFELFLFIDYYKDLPDDEKVSVFFETVPENLRGYYEGFVNPIFFE